MALILKVWRVQGSWSPHTKFNDFVSQTIYTAWLKGFIVWSHEAKAQGIVETLGHGRQEEWGISTKESYSQDKHIGPAYSKAIGVGLNHIELHIRIYDPDAQHGATVSNICLFDSCVAFV